MISRQWRGLAKLAYADDYIEHLRHETFPLLAKISGFVDASILRRDVSEGVEFLIVTRWSSKDAIQQFAGQDIEVAVVPQNVQAMMVTYDQHVRHYDVVERHD
jgi:heme-degrading monooxygenase HmoA